MPEDNQLADKLLEQIRIFEDKKPVLAAEYENIVARLQKAEAGQAAPDIGEKLPDFLLPDQDGKLQRLDQLLSKGPMVISLNRGHWCNFCRHELLAMQDIYQQVQEFGGNIVAITPERQEDAQKLKSKCALDFSVLCDFDNAYALLLGLAVWCGEEIKTIYADIGIDLARYQNNTHWLLPIPATYVLARDATIVAKFVNPDFRSRMAPDEILGALRGLQ